MLVKKRGITPFSIYRRSNSAFEAIRQGLLISVLGKNRKKGAST
jgi:hypothetical protein